MGTADEQIRVSDRVKRELERRKRRRESYNDVLERLLAENEPGDFYDGFGRWSDEDAATVREQRAKAKDDRKRRMRERAENGT
ncbi:antitoxin VapB family protein [Halomarina ordinaria]|uniref:Antitoxin VapB family protein n=1 Tax=Halomarina ordinaria TaxID=3033939 RepID=A0ABD5UFP2_9EURY|nr:antitoxin VapB family protein [Halomarina sp. PSRA2]